ncbi:MAG: hypothetical protein FJY17_00675 [Bacteroidetes bacterium]|nr:hypothetical protein [Bacteroidota bacterium]
MTEKYLYYLMQKVIPDLKVMDKFSYKDAYSIIYDLVIELKCRRQHYDSLLIEQSKWQKLITNRNVRYINSTPQGIYSFDLKIINEPTWYEHPMPKQTDFGDNNSVLKKVGYLPIEQAIEITKLIL